MPRSCQDFRQAPVTERAELPQIGERAQKISAILLCRVHVEINPCRCFREVERADYVLDVLASCQHNGFPVVRSSPGGAASSGGEALESVEGGLETPRSSGEEGEEEGCASRPGPLQGIILRSQILVMLKHRVRRPLSKSTPMTVQLAITSQGWPACCASLLAKLSSREHQ